MTEPILPFSALDDEGPALPLSDAQAQANADQIVALALAAAVKRKKRRVGAWLLLAAALASGTALAFWITTGSTTKLATPRTERASAPEIPPQIATPKAAIDTLTVEEKKDAKKTEVAASVAQAPSEASLRDLLGLANRARAERDYKRAEQLYRSVARRFPGSDDAYAALVSAGDLNREQLGNVRVAMWLYGEALSLRKRGALHEQALAGLAQSAETLGDNTSEMQAWRELLAKHPASLHRPHAETRLKQLGAVP